MINSLLVTLMACMCLPVYLVAFSNSLRQFQQREVVLTRWSFLNLRVTRLTGAAALIYSGSQLLGSGVIILGVLGAVSEANLLFLFGSLVMGWLIGSGGATLARTIQKDITEYHAGMDVNVIRYPGTVTRTEEEKTTYLIPEQSEGNDGREDPLIEDTDFDVIEYKPPPKDDDETPKT